MWVVLALGGAVTIGFSLLFSVESYALHLLVVGAIAVTVALVLYVVVQLENPFVGTEAIGPEAFEALRWLSPVRSSRRRRCSRSTRPTLR